MQHMQDKDFDQLFKDRFEEAEVTPSLNFWNAIEKEIVPQQKKRRAFPFWAAAAAVVILLSVGLVFFNRTGKIQLHGSLAAADGIVPAPNHAVASGKTVVSPASLAPEVNPVQQDTRPLQVNMLTQVRDQDDNSNDQAVVPVAENKTEKDLAVMQPIQEIAHLTTKATVIKQPVIELPKVAVKEKIVLASTEMPAATKDEVSNENDQADRKGIRNIGDLVNYVVDKVDKREEKFLKFKTDDDDNSSLIGINIGMIKFSQKKHK